MKKLFALLGVALLAVSGAMAQTVLVDYDFNDKDKTGLSIYDVDNLTPTSFMQSIGFASGTTWILIKDTEESTDMFLGSTSQYLPAGQANDWLVLPATLISSEGFVLEWKSQAFLADKRDGLKVFISTEGGLPENFPSTPVWEVAEEEIGKTEDFFEGEFVAHSLSLDDYVGKNIHIAFVNQSNDKSILCIDDIKVSRDDELAINSALDMIVFDADEVGFTGTITNNKLEKINDVAITLTYDDVEVTENFTGLNLAAGETAVFAMEHKAPIAINETLNYTLKAVAGDKTALFISSVSNYFKRRVVIEDHTGLWCSNCPAGIWGLDSLKEVAPDNIAPISVQNNNGAPNPLLVVDKYDVGLSAAGATAFPQGWVDRTYIQHPWGNGGSDFKDPNSWISLFDNLMKVAPEAGVKVTGYFNEDKTWVMARASVRTAELKENLDWRIIFVVTEDGLEGFYQSNTFTGNKAWIGGWQNKPRNAEVVLNDIARGIYPSFYGEEGSLPTTINVGEVAEYSYGISLPIESVNKKGEVTKIIQNFDNLNLIAMLVDGKTKRVINSDMVRITEVPEAVEGVKNNDDDLYVKAIVGEGTLAVSTLGNEPIAVTLVAIDGRVLAVAQGNGSVNLDTTGYQGVALVQVVANGVVKVEKVVIR